MAVGEEARTWGYAQLADEAARLAAGLAQRGVSPKEPVALFAPNAPEWVVANLALLELGATPVPLDIRQGKENLAHCLSDSGCRRAFATSEQAAALREGRVTTVVGVPRLYEALVDAIDRQMAGRGRTAAGVFRRLLAACIWTRRRIGWRAGRIVFAPIHRRMAPELQLLVSGSARLDPELGWKLQGFGWDVLSGYGLTETAPIIAFNTPARKKLESVGRPRAAVARQAIPGRRCARRCGGYPGSCRRTSA